MGAEATAAGLCLNNLLLYVLGSQLIRRPCACHVRRGSVVGWGGVGWGGDAVIRLYVPHCVLLCVLQRTSFNHICFYATSKSTVSTIMTFKSKEEHFSAGCLSEKSLC